MLDGNGWIISGYFKLVHIVDLVKFNSLLETILESANASIHTYEKKLLLDYHSKWISDRLDELGAPKRRTTRSIDWIGSAWKWIAGSPDATDWNTILQSQDEIIKNNNHQYKINEEIFRSSQAAVKKVNQIIGKTNNITKAVVEEQEGADILGKIQILRAEIAEIVRACQMAKVGIVNSNILDKEEINNLLSEMETLPYQNAIEATEYAKPSVYTNGTLLLYVLSMPKLSERKYHLLRTRAAVIAGRQLDFEFNKMLVNQQETFGVEKECLLINNSTICEMSALKKFEEESCVPRILKGGQAKCKFRANNEEIVEIISENTIFLTNFVGEIESSNATTFLNGTYVLQLDNESILIRNQTFTSRIGSHLQALPSVLTNITIQGPKVDLEYVHSLSLTNIKQLSILRRVVDVSFITDIVIIVLVVSFGVILWYRVLRRVNLPPLKQFVTQTSPPPKPVRRCQTSSDLRDADI